MPDLKMSQLPLRNTLALTDEFLNLAEGENYRSPMSALTPILGSPGSPGGDSGEFNTVADMLASTDAAISAGTVWRADGFRYREADPAATDHHLTTAGGVKLYVQPGDDGWYNFRAMDPVMDNVAGEVENADKLNKLLLLRPMGGLDAQNPAWPQGPSIQFPLGHYYFDPGPWGFQLKATTHLRGEVSFPAAATDGTIFHIKKDCVGFQVNSYDTYQNTIEFEFPPYGKGGAIGSTFEKLWLISQITPSGGNPNAHGLWLRTGATVRDVEIQNFNGNGINAVGSGAPGDFVPWFSGISVASGHGAYTDEGKCYGVWINPGTPSTVKPTHTTPGLTPYPDGYSWYYVDPLLRGGPSHCFFDRVTCVANRRSGLFMEGGDSSACLGLAMNCYANGRIGIWDSGFLGNTWIGCHSRTNGLSGSGGNSASQSSVVSLQNGPGGSYNKYYAKWGASEASLVATEPGTDENVWVSANIGGPNIPYFHPFYPVWTPGQPEGTYFFGAGYAADNNNARTIFIGCYQEGDESYSYLSLTSMSICGIANWQEKSLSLDAVGGVLTNTTGFSVTDKYNNISALAASGTSTATAFTAMQYKAAGETYPWRWRYDAALGDWFMDYAASSRPYHLTSEHTINKMGTSRTQPSLLYVQTLAMGGSTITRRQTTGSVKPTTGEWATGDVIWNVGLTPTKTAGWLVTKAGVFGSTAWTTGTNYALNAYVLATNTKYYRCSVDPGSTLLSTVEPSHASGEVIEADGFGWTFVSLTLPEILPFGETIDFYDHTSTGTALSLAVGTHPRTIIISATIPTVFNAGVSATGAYTGARFRITRTGGGAGICNVIGVGTLAVLATNQWCDLVYNGTAWVLSGYGTLYGQVSQQTLATNADFTLTPGTSPQRTRHTGTLTADRAVTLSTTGAVQGQIFRVSRSGAGAFNLNVGTGPLKALATNQWCEVVYDGTDYYLSASGAL